MARSKIRLKEPGMSWWAFWLILVIVIYCLFSLAVALGTSDACGYRTRQWVFMPPGWHCQIDRTQGYTT